MANDLIGSRIRSLRKKHELTQEDLAQLLGFNDRQTVSAIENGTRRITAQELLLTAEKLKASLEYFTDPFLLENEARFSWRQSGVPAKRVTEYEKRARRWIGTYRTLARQVGCKTRLVRPSLGLTRQSSYEDSIEAGERFADELNLGEVPAQRLVEVMEKALGILVLMVDADEGISGAACRLSELDAVLVTRGENVGRRSFNVAHELFHILTWEAMPPRHVEEEAEMSSNRVETLANNFASALLMPSAVVTAFGAWRSLDTDRLVAKLNQVASTLNVTALALRWRLVALGELSASIARSIPEASLRNNGGLLKELSPPTLFSKPFAVVVGKALKQGHVSVRRMAALMDMSVNELPSLLAAHGVEYEVET